MSGTKEYDIYRDSLLRYLGEFLFLLSLSNFHSCIFFSIVLITQFYRFFV
jgi:hypothetical protein